MAAACDTTTDAGCPAQFKVLPFDDSQGCLERSTLIEASNKGVIWDTWIMTYACFGDGHLTQLDRLFRGKVDPAFSGEWFYDGTRDRKIALTPQRTRWTLSATFKFHREDGSGNTLMTCTARIKVQVKSSAPQYRALQHDTSCV